MNSLWAFFYQKQVAFYYPENVLRPYVDYQWPLSEDYKVTSYHPGISLQDWADLLNLDINFGNWTEQRIKEEILARHIAPETSTFIFHQNRLVGCCSVLKEEGKFSKIGVGSWLFLHPAYAGKHNLSRILTLQTGAYVIKHNFQRFIGYTDPDRLPALFRYLCDGVQPLHRSLFSYYQWWKIKKRLSPALSRKQRRTK